ncbi:hypothetical protein DsansV1_C01g0012551 [Dioscorea sansibarensis]
MYTGIPKIAKKSTSRYIKGVVLNKTGRMRIQFFLLLAFMVVTSMLCISVILLQSLLSMEVLQPFFEAVSEHFIRRYCLVGVIVFYMWSMAMGRLIYYLEDAIFRDKKRENDTRLASGSEFTVMMLKNMGRVTDAEIYQLRQEYEETKRR